MAESRQHDIDKDAKAPNIFQRAKEEIEAVLDVERMRNHHKETHGMREDLNEITPLNDVKAPNVFERAKEEIEALVQTIQTKKENGTNDEQRAQFAKEESKLQKAENDVKAPNLIERAKDEIEAIIHKEKSAHHHHRETHGRSNDIDDHTPIDEVKGPNIFERAKEEIEALVETIHPKKESEKESFNFDPSPQKEGGLAAALGRRLENICSPPKEGGFRSSIGRGLETVCAWGNKKD